MTNPNAPADGAPSSAALVPEGVPPQPPPSGATSGALDPYLALIERAARDPAVDIAKLEQLMQLRERVEDRMAKAAFDNAIAQAKGEIGPIFKNREVQFETRGAGGKTSYRHEDFAAVAIAVDPVLARYGLSYRFRAKQDGPKLTVTCIVSHRDGYSEETTLEAANDTSGSKNPIQAVGSAATYLSRYSLKLALGLAASNDDDAHAVDAPGGISVDDIAFIEQSIRDTESDLPKFLATIGAASVAEMNMAQFKRGMALLAQKKRKLGASNRK